MISHQCGLNGVRVGEASHPGPRLFRKGRRIVCSSSDEEPSLAPHRNVVPRVAGATSVADATQLEVESGQLPSNSVPGPRRRRRVRSEGPDLGRPAGV